MPGQVRLVRRSAPQVSGIGQAGSLAALVAVVVVAGAVPAFAHEERATGGVQFVVGWGDEPAYTGLENSVQVSVSEAEDGSAVTDLGGALEVTVSKGTETMTLPLEPNFEVGTSGTPGDYRAWLVPTRPGTYTFRITGTVRGQSVNESFTSSETTFDDVEDVATIQFPAGDPSPGELATRIDREVPRLEASTAAVEADVRRARTLALVGVAAGGLGLVVAVGALVAISRRGIVRSGAAKGGGGKARAERSGSLSR